MLDFNGFAFFSFIISRAVCFAVECLKNKDWGHLTEMNVSSTIFTLEDGFT